MKLPAIPKELLFVASNAKVGEAAMPDKDVTKSGDPNRQAMIMF